MANEHSFQFSLDSPKATTVDTSGVNEFNFTPGAPGPAGRDLLIDGAVETYSDLLNITPDRNGSTWQVRSTSKIYTWNGTWPDESLGWNIKGEKGDQGRGIKNLTVEGTSLIAEMTSGSNESVTLPVLQDAQSAVNLAQQSAVSAMQSADSAAGSASDAATSVAQSQEIKQQVGDLKDQSQASATSAAVSATEAQSSSDSAAAAAAEADTHRQEASTSAANAAQSATIAQENANTVLGSTQAETITYDISSSLTAKFSLDPTTDPKSAAYISRSGATVTAVFSRLICTDGTWGNITTAVVPEEWRPGVRISGALFSGASNDPAELQVWPTGVFYGSSMVQGGIYSGSITWLVDSMNLPIADAVLNIKSDVEQSANAAAQSKADALSSANTAVAAAQNAESVATTAAESKVAEIVDSAPEAYNTLAKIASGKLDKNTTASTVYVVGASGWQTNIPYADTNVASAIVRRSSAGRIRGTDPYAADDMATKGYVDTNAVNYITAATPSPTANTLVKRNSSGTIAVGTPTASTHAATKAYVDAAVTPGVGRLRWSGPWFDPAVGFLRLKNSKEGRLVVDVADNGMAVSTSDTNCYLYAPVSGWYDVSMQQCWGTDSGARGCGLSTNINAGDSGVVCWSDIGLGRFCRASRLVYLSAGTKLYPWTYTGYASSGMSPTDRDLPSEAVIMFVRS